MWRDTVTKTRERFNPRAPCGARRRITRGAQPVGVGISTHAPLAGRDRREKGLHTHNFDFNPRAPCGARPCLGVTRAHYIKFQPTRPLRGATAISKKSWQIHKFQPTRPLRGATVKLVIAGVTYGISTHAPLAGRDQETIFDLKMENQFQPTRPLRGATRRPSSTSRWRTNFNPRAPCGARHTIFEKFGQDN